MLNHNVFFLKNKLFRPRAFKVYREALERNNFTPEEIEDLNFKKRSALLHFAYNNIPFYRKFYTEQGIDPQHFSNKDYWKEIPVLEKEMLRQNLDVNCKQWAREK